MKITVLGGTGYAGAELVAEAVARGHQVIAVSRTAPESPVAGAEYRQGSADDFAFVDTAIEGADAVIDALTARKGLGEGLIDVIEHVIERAAEQGSRLVVIGGAGTLRIAEGGPTLIDAGYFPEAALPAIRITAAELDSLEAGPEHLDWLYVSPARSFGAHNPGERLGAYRVGGDILLTDEQGESRLSAPDLAFAVLDELEQPGHRRQRLHFAY